MFLMLPRMKIAMEILYFDRTPVLLGFQLFFGEPRAILYDSEYSKDNNSHNYLLPPPPPEPPHTLLETCLEDYNREGWPSNRLEEIIGQLTPNAIRGPMGIRKCIK